MRSSGRNDGQRQIGFITSTGVDRIGPAEFSVGPIVWMVVKHPARNIRKFEVTSLKRQD